MWGHRREGKKRANTKHRNQEHWLAAKKLTNVDQSGCECLFGLCPLWSVKVKTCAIACNVKIWRCCTTCAQVGRCWLVHTEMRCVFVCTGISVCVSGGRCPPLPISPGRRPLSCLPFLSLDSCELGSGTREEGRKEGGRGRGDAGLEFEEGGEKCERGGKEVDIQREWLSLDQPLNPPPTLPLFGDQVLSFWGGTTGKKRSLASCFTWHLCTCTCRVGRCGGGRDKASDKAGL